MLNKIDSVLPIWEGTFLFALKDQAAVVVSYFFEAREWKL